MTEKSVVVPSLVLTYKGLFSMRQIENVVRKYMSGTHYRLADVSHDIALREHSKDQTVTFLFTYEPHIQEECRLRVSVTADNAKLVEKSTETGVHQYFDGTLKVSMRAVTYSNADEHKQTKKVSFLLMSLFRRFVYDGGGGEIGLEMKKYCYDLYDHIYGLLHMGKPPEGLHA